MADQLDGYRDRYPILADTSYLVNHSLGAMPRSARDELNRYADEWAERGVRAWSEGWWETPVAVGDELAPIVGAPAGSIAMVQNVAVAQAVIASCLSLAGPRNRVVFSELNFPSVMYTWHNVREAHVVTVRSWDGITVPTETFLAAIDERTAVVPLSHVLFKSAYIQDVEAITYRAHEVGAVVVLDCYQSAGTVPFSLSELEVDFAVGGSVKWLSGGPGAGWLYVRPDLQEALEPRLVGWQADRAPFDFRPGRIEYAPGIWRFLSGTPNVPALYAARAGYRIVREVGVPAIREKSLRMTQWIIDMADQMEIPVKSERSPERRGGTVALDVGSEDQVAAALGDRQVMVDARPGAGIRVGPHFYNSGEDLARLREGLVEILGR
ncbi:MAG: aminotransferase class V-fold PLP-dependent enzyme [Acidimicrobiia bacterium]